MLVHLAHHSVMIQTCMVQIKYYTYMIKCYS